MTVNYAQHVSPKKTVQTQPIPGSSQVRNDAGGFSFVVDDWTRFDRFLFLGAEGGTFYSSEQKLTVENAKAVKKCITEDGIRAVNRIVEISEGGKAPKNDPAVFALALCFASNDIPTKQAAKAALPKVCRIGTHLYMFNAAVEQLRGRGHIVNSAIRHWYQDRSPESLVQQAIKYQQRDGWSHRDLLRLCRPKAEGVRNDIYHWIVKGWEGVGDQPHDNEILRPIWAMEKAKRSTDKREVVRLIRDYILPRECIPTNFLTEPEVWEALLENMPMTAMVRNLATMTRVGLLVPMSAAVRKVCSVLVDDERIQKSRLHPMTILAAMLTYAQGHGERGQNTWNPVRQVVDALDAGFYTAFANVEPTGKRFVLGLDVSGSMAGTNVSGMPYLSAVKAEAAMALITASVEPACEILCFDTTIKPLSISPRQRLDDVTNAVSKLVHGGTDCALPIVHAMSHKIPADVFVIYTDSQTWAGQMHPVQAIQTYRRTMNISTKMITVAMAADKFSIGDELDGGMLNCAGLNTDTPAVIAGFVSG